MNIFYLILKCIELHRQNYKSYICLRNGKSKKMQLKSCRILTNFFSKHIQQKDENESLTTTRVMTKPPDHSGGDLIIYKSLNRMCFATEKFTQAAS